MSYNIYAVKILYNFTWTFYYNKNVTNVMQCNQLIIKHMTVSKYVYLWNKKKDAFLGSKVYWKM